MKRIPFGKCAALIGLLVVSSAYALQSTPPHIDPPTQHPIEPPADLIKPSVVPGSAWKGFYGDFHRNWCDIDTVGKKVLIKRKYRATTLDEWTYEDKELATAYFPVDLQPFCESERISTLYVAGLYANGHACIERWTCTYNGEQLSVRRLELYRGGQYGRIRSLGVDYEGRYALFLTRETTNVYQLDFASGTISLVGDSVLHPDLANALHISIRDHSTLGRYAFLIHTPRWVADLTPPVLMSIMRDPENDETFEQPYTFNLDNWDSAFGSGTWDWSACD